MIFHGLGRSLADARDDKSVEKHKGIFRIEEQLYIKKAASTETAFN